MKLFREWWENSDEAHKARHDSEEACAVAAWNAALEEMASRVGGEAAMDALAELRA